MTFFYQRDDKAIKILYAVKVHKFVLEWLEKTRGMSDVQRQEEWCKISRTKLGNLFQLEMWRPKKSKNKYICFCEVMRPILKKEYPDKPIKEITKLLGARWKTFSETSDPKLYRAVMSIWNKDKARYLAEKSLSDSFEKTPSSEIDLFRI